MTIVIAGSFKEFRRWCHNNPDLAGAVVNNGRSEHAIYANCIEKVRGLACERAIVANGWHRNPSALEVIDYLRSRGLELTNGERYA